jgi:hypothetical protein
VTVPAPTLPDPTAKTPTAAPCEEQLPGAELPSERLRQLSRKHPKAVRTVRRINTTLPGWTLRADTITDGSGIAGGAAYRRESFDTMGMASINGYILATAGVSYARPADQRLVFHASLRTESFPQEDFYGLGRESSAAAHTEYWRLALDSIGGVTFSPARTFHVTGTAGLLDVRLLSSNLAPQIWTHYLHAGAGLDLDRTDDPLFPKGERYRGSFSRYRGIDGAQGLFTRVDIDVRQYWPIPSTENHVLAARALLMSVQSQDAAAVPFYFLPRLGGATTLRSYDNSRLTDRDALAVNLEYRLRVNRLQVLGLVDLGDVAPTLTDLRPSKFHTSTGAGVRFQAGGTFLPGVDVAHGREGWAVIVRLGHAF